MCSVKTEIKVTGPAIEDLDELYVRVSSATVFVGDVVHCGKFNIANRANLVLDLEEAEDLLKKLSEKIEELKKWEKGWKILTKISTKIGLQLRLNCQST